MTCKSREPAEIGFGLLRRDRFDRQIEAGADHLHRILHRHAFFRDRVIFRAALGPFDREPIEPRGIEHMRRRPAILTVADIGADALFTGHRDGIADEALFHRVVHLRQAHDGDVDAFGCDRCRRLFRGCARMHVARADRVVFKGRLTGHGVGQSRARRHDQRTIRARNPFAERLDDAPVILAIGDEFREVVLEGEMDDAIGSRRARFKTGLVLDRSADDFSTRGGQRHRFVVGTAQAEHLMA